MRVALYLSEQPPTVGGGYTFESQILKVLLDSLAPSRHQFFLYSRSPFLGTDSIPATVPLIPLHTGPGSAGQPWTEAQILASLQAHQIELILSLAPRHLTLEIPFITIVWDLQHRLQPYFPEVSSGGEWEARERFFAQLLARAAYIITGTEVGKQEIERFYNIAPSRIQVIPAPTPPFVFHPSPQPEPILQRHGVLGPYLFYPAQFWPHKNHVGALLALQILREQYQLPLSLVFTGSDQGNLAFVQAQAARLGLTEQVHFLGFIPQRDLVALYQKAFALLFMTFFGPDNLPPLEAMALGCPVIASDVPGHREQLAEAALLVDPKSPEAMTAAILKLWQDRSLRQTYIQRGWQRARQWTTQDYVQSLLALLDNFEAIRRCWP
ncbi:glycosyltransferase family 1 protein [Synechocystis sp. LKSZ1]|uniref:glycosyltransferase family 4 protein n=1 Tax=Synechocystis sp. LKSZ1 TaxID=3144951 RepID=UPI00336C132F